MTTNRGRLSQAKNLMQGNTNVRNVKALEAALATAKATVAAIEAALADPIDRSAELLDARQTLAEYHVGRDGLLAAARRGELVLSRGPRNRVLVERQEMERWLKSRPLKPRERVAPANDLASWDVEAERELRAVGGGE
jgi:hypothetical protein